MAKDRTQSSVTRALRAEEVAHRIYELRGQRVILDADLAALYSVSTGRLNEAVDRNRARFPADFQFRLTAQEAQSLISQIAISKIAQRGGRRRSTPRAFTEQGVAMLSSVLRSGRAVQVNVEIMRAFVRLRRLHGDHADLARRLDELEATFDYRFRIVFDAIRAPQTPPEAPSSRPPIGFRP
jgi:hypothetical protein